MTNDKIEVYLRSVTLPSRLPELLDSYDFRNCSGAGHLRLTSLCELASRVAWQA